MKFSLSIVAMIIFAAIVGGEIPLIEEEVVAITATTNDVNVASATSTFVPLADSPALVAIAATSEFADTQKASRSAEVTLRDWKISGATQNALTSTGELTAGSTISVANATSPTAVGFLDLTVGGIATPAILPLVKAASFCGGLTPIASKATTTAARKEVPRVWSII